MALTDAKGSLEEQARAELFRREFEKTRERQAAELAARTSELRSYEDASGNVWSYTVIGGELVRIEGVDLQAEELFVPEQIEDLPVVAISADALADKQELVAVHIGLSVEQIGAYVLRNCRNLRVADLACSATKYDSTWLKGCGAVEELRVPERATALKPIVFELQQLKRLYLGEDMAQLEPGMFAKSKLETIEINPHNAALRTDGRGIYSIDGSTFIALVVPQEHYELAETCRTVGKKAFANMQSLQQVTVPEELEVLDEFAFAWTGITSFHAPQSLRVIARQAFFNCRKLTDLQLNEGLEVVGDEAFTSTAITRLMLPRTVSALGKRVAYRTALTCSGEDATFTIEEGSDAIKLDTYGVLYAIEPQGLRVIRSMDTSIEHIELLPGTYMVSDSAFSSQMGLASIVLPEGLRIVGKDAFRDCRFLERVVVPSTLEEVGDGAFLDTCIKEFDVPARLEKIGRQALMTLGAHHEDWAPELELVNVDPANKRFYKVDGMLCERKDDGHSQVVVYDGTSSVVRFPDEVDTVCPYAFSGTQKLRELHISDRVRVIGMRGLAFDCVLDNIYIECTKPIEGHEHFHFSFPDTKRGKAQQNNAFGQLQTLDVEYIFRGYDLTITNSARFDNKDSDDLALYDQVTRLVKRLEDPIFLRPVHLDTIEKMFTFNTCEICVAVARRDDRELMGKLKDMGYINKDNILEITDAVAALKDAAMTGFMLEMVRSFGLDDSRYEV